MYTFCKYQSSVSQIIFNMADGNGGFGKKGIVLATEPLLK
jgi:hypothetical protein